MATLVHPPCSTLRISRDYCVRLLPFMDEMRLCYRKSRKAPGCRENSRVSIQFRSMRIPWL
ncbi:hypothetical protein RSAG8_05613, partial [Rhizoctonia solani AG-8 WAC10335]